MGAAEDIKQGLTKGLANFTKQQKAEEKHTYTARWRASRMTEVRGKFLTEAANEVMRDCYNKASDNNTLPAHARQIFYVARPLIEGRSGKPLSYSYFSQTLLPNYVNEHGAGWDVVFDDRGHFIEPHTERTIGLGTLSVREYLSKIHEVKFDEAGFASAAVQTYGPGGNFSAVLYVEKEGFLPLFERVKLAERFDIAIMSSKGMSVTAARLVVETICRDIPLLVLHDFDAAGIIIKDTLASDTRRFSYSRRPHVIDLGLQFEDIADLRPEDYDCPISAERFAQAGLQQDAIDFLRNERVELNSMTSRQLVDFVEAKLKQHGVRKVVPDAETLARTYQMFAASDRLSEAFDEMKERLDASEERVPDDLEAQVKAKLEEKRDITWHRAVRLIVDPDAPEDEDEEEDNDGDGELDDDEDLSDIDE